MHFLIVTCTHTDGSTTDKDERVVESRLQQKTHLTQSTNQVSSLSNHCSVPSIAVHLSFHLILDDLIPGIRAGAGQADNFHCLQLVPVTQTCFCWLTDTGDQLPSQSEEKF